MGHHPGLEPGTSVPMSVISTDPEGAKRLRASGEIPRMRTPPCWYREFLPGLLCPWRPVCWQG